jgi:hypothetical protein
MAPRILTSALDGGEWSASRPGPFTPVEITPGNHWTGGCVGPRAGLDAVAKRKIPCPCRESSPDRSARNLVGIRTELIHIQGQVKLW